MDTDTRHQVLVHVVSALFDINPSMSTHMPVHLWNKCAAVLLELLDLLKEHPNVVLDEAYEVRGDMHMDCAEGTCCGSACRG